MWIFTGERAYNTDAMKEIFIWGDTICFDKGADCPTIPNIHCGSEDRAKYIYKDIMSELGKGTLIFNVDRRLGK